MPRVSLDSLNTIAAVAPIAPTEAIASALVKPTLRIDAAKVASAGTTASIPAMRNGMAIVVPTAIDVPIANVFIFPEDMARGRMGVMDHTSFLS